MMINTRTGILNNYLDDVFRSAYARQGMKYEPLNNDAYEYDER